MAKFKLYAKKAADEIVGGGSVLKDLDVERVDGVDKPATGRSFLVRKSQTNWEPTDLATPELLAAIESGRMSADQFQEAVAAGMLKPGPKPKDDFYASVRRALDTADTSEGAVHVPAAVEKALRPKRLGQGIFTSAVFGQADRIEKARLGNGHLLQPRPTDATRKPMWPASDNWLGSFESPYVGGAPRGRGGDYVSGPKSPKPADASYPDIVEGAVNENYQDPNEDDVTAAPADTNEEMRRVRPGKLPTTPVTKRRRGLFTSWLKDVTSTPSGFEAPLLGDVELED